MGVTSFLLVSCLGLAITAQELTCDPPPSVVDGSYSPVSGKYTEGDVVQYRCQADFVLRGSQKRTCSKDRTFKPAAPTCVSDASSPKPWAIAVGIVVSMTILWVHY